MKMQLKLLKSKIHRATVTEAHLHYEGSVTIDPDLMQASDILEYEQVDILNINNGERFTTYAIAGEKGSGVICINGAAARLAQVGDLVIICAYAEFEADEAKGYKAKIVSVNDKNEAV